MRPTVRDMTPSAERRTGSVAEPRPVRVAAGRVPERQSHGLARHALRCSALLVLAFVTAACGGEDAVTPPCDIDRAGPDYEPIETRCDGLDNDCDGLTDELLPDPANACTDPSAACRQGFAACVGGERRCHVRPAVAEVHDGQDNDCDGETDEPPGAATLPARARIAVPYYLWEEALPAVSILRTTFDWVGLPYDSPTPVKGAEKGQWEIFFTELDRYSLVVMPGYLTPTFVDDAQLQALKAWVTKGGVLVWTKVLGPGANSVPALAPRWQAVAELGGFTTQRKAMETERVRLTGRGPATLWLDMPEERDVLLAHDGADVAQQVEVFTYDLAPGTEVVATAASDHAKPGAQLGATWLRRTLGQGAVYTLGFDPTTYTRSRCYVNCFDPGLDVAVQLIKGAWRESQSGHYVVKHTVPGTESAVFLPSHDVDAPDANNAGSWGEAGAVQMAEMERVEGVRGAYFVTTDYVRDYYNPAMVKRLCQLNMCPAGGHSVQHLLWGEFPKGDCSVGPVTYDTAAPTVCGEVAVNLTLLRQAVPPGTRLDSWRTPYLNPNPNQYHVLSLSGVRYDSSLAVGDLRVNLPVDLPRYRYFSIEELSDVSEMWVLPLGLEDGMGSVDAAGAFTRRELSPTTWPEFQARWKRNLRGNAGNGGWATLLVHPSLGIGPDVPATNLERKVASVRWAIREAKALGMRVESVAELGDFWRGRQGAQISDVVYKDGVYTGKIVVGSVPARRLSLEFGDRIASFEHNTSSAVDVDGRRVAFQLIMPAGGVIGFTARVAK